MKGAIFYSGQYGSTAQYADWVSEATGLPVFSIHDSYADPRQFDFLVLGSSVIVYKLTIRKWIYKHLVHLGSKPVILFTVSGAKAGPKLTKWIADCLPPSLVSRSQHVALGGRLNFRTVPWWIRMFLKIGASRTKNPEVKKQELEGYDFMDKSGIDPIVEMANRYKFSQKSTA